MTRSSCVTWFDAFFRFTRTGRWAGWAVIWGAAAGTAACARPLTPPPSDSGSAATAAATTGSPTSAQVPVDANDVSWGNAEAPVTVVAFLDFECPFCARVHPTLVQLMKDYGPEKLRVVVKHAPLPFHERGLPAALAAQAVYRLKGTDAFFEYVAKLFESASGDAQTDLSDAKLTALAQAQGITKEVFEREVQLPEVRSKVNDDAALYAGIGLGGVPGFLINGALLSGARPITDFETLIDHEVAAAEELRRRGVAPGEVYAKRVQVNFRPPPAEGGEGGPAFEEVAYQVPIGASPSLGPADAPVTIVEFADFECPFCERAHATVEQLLEKYPGKLRWVMKHNPLPFHPAATPAAITALEIQRQKGDAAYWRAVKRFYDADALTPDLILRVAEDEGVAEKPLLERFEADSLPPELQADEDLAMDLQAHGTPHFFVNGRRLSGAQPLEVFSLLIEEELAKVAKANLEGDVYAALQKDAAAPPALVKHDLPPSSPANPVLGPADAPVTVDMFSDFECPYCQRVLPTIARLRSRFPGKIKVVWRNLPLSFHPHARLAANAAMEAKVRLGDAAFWQMAERLTKMPGVFTSEQSAAAYAENPPGFPELSAEFVKRQAIEMGLDGATFMDAVTSGKHDALIQSDEAVARRLGVNGTPAFFVGGYALSGAQPLERFERLVRLALSEAGAGAATSPRAPTKTSAAKRAAD